jgi:phage-related protein
MGDVALPEKKLVILSGDIKTPPLSQEARREVGYLLRRLQRGDSLGLPLSRPMPSIGPRCHELRITDVNRIWRFVYRTDDTEILVAEVFAKTTRATPKHVIANCKKRLREWDSDER